MNKIKAAVIDGPEDILGYFGDQIQKTDNLREANLIILAGNTEISPEYYGQKAKNNSIHDPVKDRKIYNILNEICLINRKALIVGLRNSSNYIHVFRGGLIEQKYDLNNKTIIASKAYGHDGSLIMYDSQIKYPKLKQYNHFTGLNVQNYIGVKYGYKEHAIVSRYPQSVSKNTMIAVHLDPFMLDPYSAEWLIVRSIIDMNCWIKNPYDTPFRIIGDISIWASASNYSRDMNYELDSRICFGMMVKGPLAEAGAYNNKIKVKWTIKVKKPNGWNPEDGRCITFFKKEDYDKYYKRLQQLYPFDYTIDDSRDEYVMISLTIDAPCMWHKIILTQIRYIYQYPMHFILKDALELKKMKEYKDIDILDLLNVVAKSLSNQVYESGEYMLYPYCNDRQVNDSINKILKPINDKDFRHLAESHGNDDKYPSINSISKDYTTNCPEGFKVIKDTVPCCISWNVFIRTFDLRLPFYSNNIKVFKRLLK